jgi:hypothetical protein
MKSILDPSFKYTNAASTDVAATFRRIRREQAEAVKREHDATIAEQFRKVQPLVPRRKA